MIYFSLISPAYFSLVRFTFVCLSVSIDPIDRIDRFLIKHKEIPLFQDIIAKGLDRFIKHQILQFDDAREIPIHFIGSISFFLKEEIERALKVHGLSMGIIVQRPIDELVNFHKNLIELNS